MKKVFNLIAVMALAITPIVATGCSGNTKTEKEDTEKAEKAEDAEKTEEAEEAEAAEIGGVSILDDDNAIRPNMSVERLTVLDFNATWCGPCKQLAPVFEEKAKKYAEEVDFVSIDIDNCPATANAFGIEGVPTVVFLYPDGRTQTFVGTGELLPAEKFEALISNALK